MTDYEDCTPIEKVGVHAAILFLTISTLAVVGVIAVGFVLALLGG